MVKQKGIICLLVACLVATTVSIPHLSRPKGRKLFGGYRIAPKVCQPTNPGRLTTKPSTTVTDESTGGQTGGGGAAICMFNYDCSQRGGEVVGACMDGFLFGACCQLPAGDNYAGNPPNSDHLNSDLDLDDMDHVPDVPILLNPDGTPVSSNVSPIDDSTTTYYTKSGGSSTKDSYQNAEKPQVPLISPSQQQQLEDGFSVLLGSNNVLDGLKLSSLITHQEDTNNDIGHENKPQKQQLLVTPAVNPVTTLLSPDQILQVADPVDQLPALFSHGLHKNSSNNKYSSSSIKPINQNATVADTILLDENGVVVQDTSSPDELFRPITKLRPPSTSMTNSYSSSSQTPSIFSYSTRYSPVMQQQKTEESATTPLAKTATTRLSSSQTTTSGTTTTAYLQEKSSSSSITQMINNEDTTFKKVTEPMIADKNGGDVTATTPLSLTTRNEDDSSIYDEELVRVPTITYNGGGGNSGGQFSDNNKKKHPQDVNREEVAINHIISILNDTNDTKKSTTANSGYVPGSPTTYNYISPSSGPTLFKIITTHSLPSSSSGPTTESLLPSSSTGSSSSHSASSVSPSYYHYITDSGHFTSNPYFASSGSPPINSYSSKPYFGSSGSPASISTYTSNPYYASSGSPTSINAHTSNPYYPSSGSPTSINAYTSNPYYPSAASPSSINAYTSSSGSSGSSTIGSSSSISGGPTTNPPAPTVIVLGPLNTEYASSTATQATPLVRPGFVSKRPPPGVITHNISTVISGNKQVLSVSYISVDLKDGTTAKPASKRPPATVYTTLTTWPSFQPPRPSSPAGCEDDTQSPPSDDINNFPPVRHPDLDAPDKLTLVEPEIISADEIPSPDFVEDAELNNKVEVFVSKIVESLKDNFENLKDVVYNPTKNVTTKRPLQQPQQPSRPPVKSTTRRPTTSIGTKFTPTTIKPRPTTSKITKPTTTKRVKPTKKTPTSTTTTTTTVATTSTEEIAAIPTEPSTTPIPEITPDSDYRSICGIRPLQKTGRIVGGKGATFAEWPWQVLVREATWLGLFTKNKCGGVLITNKYVITAAHCQPGFLASLVAVFGEFDISGELESRRSVTRNVHKVIVNRAYDPATFENDLALLELETPVQFDGHIVPICMPDDNTDYVNRMATVTGWGRLKYNGGVPSVLQEVRVPIMENSVCQEMFHTAGHKKLILDSFMCAGYANGQKDSCEGDSGGPLTLQRPDGRWILVGTVSHGIKCAAPYLPGVYMRTTYFKPWLHSFAGV